jgi:endonuclease G
MKLLDATDLIQLHQVIVDAGAASRAFIEGMIAPLLPSFVARLPDPEPARLLQVLSLLNTSGRLVDGTLPIEIALTVLRTAPFAAVAELAGKKLAKLAGLVGPGSSGPEPVEYSAGIQEAYTGPSDATLPFGFLVRGAEVGRAVMKLVVPRYDNGQPAIGPSGEPRRFLGTGWLIAHDIVITNLHVVSARESDEPDAPAGDLALQIAATELVLDFDAPGITAPPTAKVVAALVTGARGGSRDYALLRVAPRTSGWPSPLVLRRQPPAIPREGYPVNIVQHPAGLAKRISIRRNLMKAATAAELSYFGDTLGGSSGSPLCNDAWEVIGLHRASGPSSNVLVNGREAASYNLGVPIAAILDDIERADKKIHAEIAPRIAAA